MNWILGVMYGRMIGRSILGAGLVGVVVSVLALQCCAGVVIDSSTAGATHGGCPVSHVCMEYLCGDREGGDRLACDSTGCSDQSAGSLCESDGEGVYATSVLMLLSCEEGGPDDDCSTENPTPCGYKKWCRCIPDEGGNKYCNEEHGYKVDKQGDYYPCVVH